MSVEKDSAVNHILQSYGDMLYRTAWLLLGNSHDVQDALQETLLRYLEKAPAFVSEAHEKAWLLRVTANCCKDSLRFRRRHSYLNLEELQEQLPAPERNSRNFGGRREETSAESKRSLKAGAFLLTSRNPIPSDDKPREHTTRNKQNA